jgi:hypothetical protein
MASFLATKNETPGVPMVFPYQGGFALEIVVHLEVLLVMM